MTRYARFTDDPARGALLAWWSHLCEHDLGGRAQLRRCESPAQVVFVPAFHRLLDRLKTAGLMVDVDRAAFHCVRSARRAGLWQPETWDAPTRISFGKIYADALGQSELEPVFDKLTDESNSNLY